MLCFATSAQGARNLETGFADTSYVTSSGDAQSQLFQTSVAEGAGIARFNVIWADVAPNKPANPKDPGDPAYSFGALDGAVRAANAQGLDVLLTIYRAPSWAEGPDRPPVNFEVAPEGTWKPDPKALADLGTALATRYSGSYVPASGGGPLPQVRYYESWNEENFWAYVSPQYEGKYKEVGVEQYRAMLNAFYDAVKAVSSRNKILVGGLGPYGDPPPTQSGVTRQRTRPLDFLRRLFCLSPKLNPLSCPDPAKFDILGTHPINTSGGPTQSALNPNDVSSADLPHVAKVLHAAERLDTLATRGHHPMWATEFWWESYPDGGVPAKPGLVKHGKWIEQALYLFWTAGARVAINLQLIDDVYGPDNPGSLQTGVFLSDGTPKPAATSFRFPFVLDRQSKKKVFVWGKSPEKGKLKIQQKHGGRWHKVKRLKVKDNKVFTTRLHVRGKGKYRARVGDQTSLVWTLRK
jgi:hypothetical protein